MGGMNSSYIEVRVPAYEYAMWSKEEFDELLRRRIEYAERELAINLFKSIKESPVPVVVQTHMEQWHNSTMPEMVFRLHYNLTAVRTMNVTMAFMEPLTFQNHSGKIEWKCGFCGVINPIEATVCGEKHDRAIGCGHPREKTRQEMYG